MRCSTATPTTRRSSLLLDRSGGNPFFIEELVAYMQESNHADRATEVPATLHGLLAARLDALDPAERSLLEDCAVVGASGPISAATRASCDRADATDAARPARRHAISSSSTTTSSTSSRSSCTRSRTERSRKPNARAATRASPSVLQERGDEALDQVAEHLAAAAELVIELGAVPGVPVDVREQAVAALERAAERAEGVESWILSGRHHDRALKLIPDEPGPTRWNALLGRARSGVEQRRLEQARDDILTVIMQAREAGETTFDARASTLLGEAEIAAGAYDVAEQTLAEALDAVARDRRRERHRAHAAQPRLRADLPRRARRRRTDRVRGARLVPVGRATAAAKRGRCRTWRGSRSRAARSRTPERRLNKSADVFSELGDWGGLGWAYGLLAFVRYNQGRLDEAATLAEHIAIEGAETGNRWAVGMMSVLLANVDMWRGQVHGRA